MRKIKKITSVFLAVVMVLSCLSLSITAFAAGDATVSADAVSAKAGETVTVTFKVANCKDAKALMFYGFTYNTDALTMEGGEWLFASSAMQDVSVADKSAVIAFSENSAVNGDILKMNFKVADNAAAGDYEIDFDVVFKAATDAADKDIDVTVTSAVISVKGEENTEPETKKAIASASAVAAKAGESATVTVSLADCADAKSIMFYNFSYDPEVFTFEGGNWLLSGSAMSEISKNDNTAVIAFSENSAVNGDVLSLNFKVADGAAAGEYEIGFDVIIKVDTDADDAELEVVVNAAVVTVEAAGGSDNPPVDNSYSLGDVDNNGTINAADARTILRCSAKLDQLSDAQLKAADIDGNSTVTAADARIALRISAQLEKIEDYIKEAETTTAAPTTAAPTTAAPTTAAPTTAAPTTEVPTTEEPTTEAPATEEPTTEEPTTEEPTTEEPTTEEPTTEEPTTEEPTTEEPTTEEPTTEEPTTEEPTTEEPTTEEPTTEEPTTEEPTTGDSDDPGNDESYNDLNWYLDLNIESVMSDFEDLAQDADEPYMYYTENIYFWIDDYGFVTEVGITDESAYNIYGVKYGMDYDEAVANLEDSGFAVDEYGCAVDEFGYNIWLLSEDGETVSGIMLFYYEETEYDEYDLSLYLLDSIDNLAEYIELTDEGDGWYDADFTMFFYAPYGRISQVVINDVCEYNICGIEFGMDRETALETLAAYGFTMEDDTYGEDLNGYLITLSYDEENDTVNYITYSNPAYDVYDLTWYMYVTNYITNYLDAEEDGSGWYLSDNGYNFYVCEEADYYDYTVEIIDECDFNILGIMYGTDRETALELLADAYFEMYDDTYGESIFGETISIEYAEDDTVCFISLCDSSLNTDSDDLGSYVCGGIEYLLENIDLNTDGSGWYYDANITVRVYAEDDMVTYVEISGVNDFNIYGISYGMDRETVLDILSNSVYITSVSDTYCETIYGETITIEYAEDDTVDMITCSIDTDDGYDIEYDLSCYLGIDYDTVDDEFPLEDGESYSMYGNNGFSFNLDNYVEEIMINGESVYNIFGVEYGMDTDTASAFLEAAGYEVDVFDTVIYGENADDGTYIMGIVSDGTIASISYAYM